MRFFMMIIFAISAVFAGQNAKLPEIYSTKMSDLEIHIISLAKSAPPVEKLIPNNNDNRLNKSLGLDKSDLEIVTIPAYGHTAGHTMIATQAKR